MYWKYYRLLYDEDWVVHLCVSLVASVCENDSRNRCRKTSLLQASVIDGGGQFVAIGATEETSLNGLCRASLAYLTDIRVA
jgi:hypothetical protein